MEGSRTGEDDWLLTLAWQRAVGDYLTPPGEVLHLDTIGEERARIGVASHQERTIAQVSARVTR